jgi:hypothetical protein
MTGHRPPLWLVVVAGAAAMALTASPLLSRIDVGWLANTRSTAIVEAPPLDVPVGLVGPSRLLEHIEPAGSVTSAGQRDLLLFTVALVAVAAVELRRWCSRAAGGNQTGLRRRRWATWLRGPPRLSY